MINIFFFIKEDIFYGKEKCFDIYIKFIKEYSYFEVNKKISNNGCDCFV